MKTLYLSIAIVGLVRTSEGVEPLYVPPADFASYQPQGPALQPLPEPHLGSPGPLPGSFSTPTYSQPVYSTSQPVYSTPVPLQPSYSAPLPVIAGPVVPLYPNVRVRSAHLAWPGGAKEVVQIPNPLPRSGNCEPVYVQICVPPGCQPIVSTGPRGQRLTYAFGGYRVEVTSLRGVVTIDYDRR
jgi:hypothetical protein